MVERRDDGELGSWITEDELERYSRELRERPWGRGRGDVPFEQTLDPESITVKGLTVAD